MEELLRPCIRSRYINRFPVLFCLMCLLRGWCVFVRACVCVNLRCCASVSRFSKSSSSSSPFLWPPGVPYSLLLSLLPCVTPSVLLLVASTFPSVTLLSISFSPSPPLPSLFSPLASPHTLTPSPSLCFVLQVLVSRQAWESLAASSIFTVSVGRHISRP